MEVRRFFHHWTLLWDGRTTINRIRVVSKKNWLGEEMMLLEVFKKLVLWFRTLLEITSS